MENKDLGPRKGETAAQFKVRIDETKRELAREEAAKAPVAAQEPPKDPQAATPNPGAPQVTLPPEPVKTPVIPEPPKVVTGNPEVDEWIGKKGFKSTEDIISSLREAEREIMKRKEEQPKPVTPPAPIAAPPSYPPYYPPAPPPIPWAGYPPPPVHPSPVNVERLAKQYDLEPQDFEKVAAVANDMAQSIFRQEWQKNVAPIINSVQQVNREVGRQKELVSLMADPLARNPQVQFELHRVLEEDPSIFERHPQPYRYAFDTALTRIARANLGGSNAAPPAPTQPPAGASRPPMTAGGNGSGGGGPANAPPTDKISPEQFAALPLAEKKAHLQSVGAM